MGTLAREDEVVRGKKWRRNEDRCGIRAKDWTGLARRLQAEWDKAMRKRVNIYSYIMHGNIIKTNYTVC